MEYSLLMEYCHLTDYSQLMEYFQLIGYGKLMKNVQLIATWFTTLAAFFLF